MAIQVSPASGRGGCGGAVFKFCLCVAGLKHRCTLTWKQHFGLCLVLVINHRKAFDSELSPALQDQVSRIHSHEMEAGGGERNCGSPCVPKMYATIPASRTSECDLPRKEGLCGCKQLG